MHDVFICHASEDKDDIARPLAIALRERHLDVWFDEFTIKVGDSLREKIDKGLAESRFGIVILSPNFFKKGWPQWELGGLVTRQNKERRSVILPIWHNVSYDVVALHSPPLANLHALCTDQHLNSILNELVERIRPEQDPLIVAKNFLESKGVSAPSLSDQWWLDIVEFKERELHHRAFTMSDLRWVFPLPYSDELSARERGINLGWTALQWDWAYEGYNKKICQLTHPEQVHEFLREWPGLFECARDNPAVLAIYAPQLTIPGYDTDFENAFDSLLASEDAFALAGYSEPDTLDGKPPLCGELIAWRHPTFGNYATHELAYSFIHAHNTDYSRYVHSPIECLVWLLSDQSNWLPVKLHDALIDGMRSRDNWFSDAMRHDHDFTHALLKSPRSKFKVTKEIRRSLEKLFDAPTQSLAPSNDPATIANRFIDHSFISGFYDWQDKLKEARRGTRKRR